MAMVLWLAGISGWGALKLQWRSLNLGVFENVTNMIYSIQTSDYFM